jgi:flagellin-specific chaperone FliS
MTAKEIIGLLDSEGEMAQDRRGIIAYQQEKILTSSRAELLKMCYDIGYRACQARDGDKVKRLLYELESALDYSKKDMAHNLLQIYQYVMSLVRSDKYEEAAEFFRVLGESWGTVIGSLEEKS